MFRLFGSQQKKPVAEEKKQERKKNYVTIFTFSRDKLYFPIIEVTGVDGLSVSMYVMFTFKIRNMEEFRKCDPMAQELMEELNSRLKGYRREYRSKDYMAGGGTLIIKLCEELLAKHYPFISVSNGEVEFINTNNS